MSTNAARRPRASEYLPRGAFDGQLRTRFAHALPLAALAYAGAIAVYVFCVVFVQLFSLGNASLSVTLVILFGSHFLIATPTTLSCINVASRWRHHSADASDEPTLRRVDLALTICAVIATVLVIGDVLGFFAVFGLKGQTGWQVVYALLLQAAAAVASAAAGVWALAEIAAMRAAAPAAGSGTAVI